MGASRMPEIHALVPHQGRMCLLDEVVAFGDTWLETAVEISPESMFLEGDGVGAWVGIEYMAQTVAACNGRRNLAAGVPAEVGLLISIRFYESAVPAFVLGSRLSVRADYRYEAENGISSFDCQIRCHGAIVATASLTVYVPPDVVAYLEGNRQ